MLVETGKKIFCLSLNTGKQSGTFRPLGIVLREPVVGKKRDKQLKICWNFTASKGFHLLASSFANHKMGHVIENDINVYQQEISQYANASVNSSSAHPPPPRAIVGHFPALSIPGVGR